MINNSASIWGVKRSGHNIQNDIINIITNAQSYIIVGGYNFTFKTAGYSFFRELYRKSTNGIPVLMIIPPNLSGNNRSHQDAIDFCITNGIGLILNGNNHSKWILTENDLYYGSSNFSETSWKNRVEVITIHDLRSPIQWKTRTIKDFKDFVFEEISKVHNRRIMTRRPGLIVYTRIVWNSIKFQMLKLNPSIKKVQQSLNNFEVVTLRLENLCAYWFESEYFSDYLDVRRLSKLILRKVNKLCFFAYTNIYNESLSEIESHDLNIEVNPKVIARYNEIHMELLATIEICKEKLLELDKETNYDLNSKNKTILKQFSELLK